jgi:uncharacterized protein YecT (DUF1311 family)
MKYFFAIAICLLYLSTWAQTKPKEKDCRDTATSDSELEACARKYYLEADAKLNRVYKAILESYKSDTAFIKNLKISESLWIKLRDAEMNMKYPDREPGWYGSVQPMCYYMYLESLTNDRINYLQQWLDGIEEGDVCFGSVKIKRK